LQTTRTGKYIIILYKSVNPALRRPSFSRKAGRKAGSSLCIKKQTSTILKGF